MKSRSLSNIDLFGLIIGLGNKVLGWEILIADGGGGGGGGWICWLIYVWFWFDCFESTDWIDDILDKAE